MSDADPAIALLVVRDVLGAGLLGALVEAEGFTAAFPLVGERADLAVRRLRPAVVLLDGYHPAARRDELFDACGEVPGCRVVLFAPGAPWGLLDEVRRERGVAFVAPAGGESLAALLRAALHGPTGG